MNARLYATLLTLYPAELREDFGDEMTHVFLEDLNAARRFRGHRGTARVWVRTIKELCVIALPAVIAKREIAVPLIMSLGQEIYLSAILLLAPGQAHAARLHVGELFCLVSAAAIIPAIVASLVIRVGDSSVPVPLNLTRK